MQSQYRLARLGGVAWQEHVAGEKSWLQGKSVVVTGGNSGIGEAIVLAASAEGARSNGCVDRQSRGRRRARHRR
jgi:NADPH:quinone reductase-like Zn-dependent oxidoreductase